MKAAVICIGDEILIGQVVDTNSAWISRRLSDAGAQMVARFTVGDTAEEISGALDDALRVADAVIMTGGLGPTKDDVTKTTLARYFGMALREDAGVLEDVRAMLTARGIDVNSLNRAQALVPNGCRVLRNANGTAPGMWFERDGRVVVSLPGVPFEMKALISGQVLPLLRERFGQGDAVHRTVHTSGIAESVLAERLAGWEASLPRGVKLAYLPSTSGVRLRLSSVSLPAAEAREIIEGRLAELESLLGHYLLGEGEQDPAAAVAALLRKEGKTLSVAESCTGGKIAETIVSHEGASSWFMGGVVAYGEGVKEKILQISAETLEKEGVVSEKTAILMAEGIRRVTGSDYAVSTTGYAGPDGGADGQPVGTVWIGIAHPGGCYARKMRFGKLRQPNIERASSSALNLLRLLLTGDLDAPVASGVS
ncbi:MAG: competence/damage-inducible protein A [Rikenellaceae bacterium]|nr:competence/damage-inducible protein A [Rikenellaceae bacterium]